MAEIPRYLAYDYVGNDNMLYPILDYIKMYLARFDVINLKDSSQFDYSGCSLDGVREYYKPIYSFNGKSLSISHDNVDYANRTWFLRYGNYQVASIHPDVIKIKRKMKGIDIPQEWCIESKSDAESISIKCSVFNGISFQIKIERVTMRNSNLGNLVFNVSYKGMRGTHTINIHQSLDEQFFKPRNYLDFLASRINLVRYDKDNQNYEFECGLIYDVVHDSRIEDKLKSLMPGELLDCVDIEREGSVYIKTAFVKG